MRDFNKMDFVIQNRRIALIERFIPQNSYLLDVGCGYYPQNLISLESKIKRGIGIDIDIPETAPSNKIGFIKYNIEKALPFPNKEFDCVTILAVLEHLEFPKEVIKECFRVLKPGGKIIITIPSNYSKPLLTTLAGIGLISKEEIYGHKNYFSKKEVHKMLSDASFKRIVSRFYNLFMNVIFVYEK